MHRGETPATSTGSVGAPLSDQVWGVWGAGARRAMGGRRPEPRCKREEEARTVPRGPRRRDRVKSPRRLPDLSPNGRGRRWPRRGVQCPARGRKGRMLRSFTSVPRRRRRLRLTVQLRLGDRRTTARDGNAARGYGRAVARRNAEAITARHRPAEYRRRLRGRAQSARSGTIFHAHAAFEVAAQEPQVLPEADARQLAITRRVVHPRSPDGEQLRGDGCRQQRLGERHGGARYVESESDRVPWSCCSVARAGLPPTPRFCRASSLCSSRATTAQIVALL